jgi:hypothetical protein
MRGLLATVVFGALILGHCSCPRRGPSEPPSAKAPAAAPITIGLKLEATGTPQWGDLVPARISVRNSSADVVVLRRVELADQLPDVFRWFGGQYGEATYDQGQDVWHFRSEVQVLSRPVFSWGALLPGEERVVPRTLRLRQEWQSVTVTFQRVAMAEAQKLLYFPAGAPPPLGETDFQRMQGPVTAKDLGVPEQRVVIFPSGAQQPKETAAADVPLTLSERSLDLEAAARQARLPVSAVKTFWLSQKAYILDGGAGGMLMVSEGAATPLPRCDPLVFDLMDLAGDKPVEVLLPLTGFDDLFTVGRPHTEGPGYFNPGYTSVAQADLPKLLERCRGLNLPVTVQPIDPTGLGAANQIAVGDAGDLGQRRSAAPQPQVQSPQ